MRIVFMGTPDFAVPCLKRLVDDGNEVVGVFTQPDKPKGRGYTLTPPPVKVFAEENGIPVFQPKSMRDGEALEILKRLNRLRQNFTSRNTVSSEVLLNKHTRVSFAEISRSGPDTMVHIKRRKRDRSYIYAYERGA